MAEPYFNQTPFPFSITTAVEDAVNELFRAGTATAGNIQATLGNPNFFRGLALSIGEEQLFKNSFNINVEEYESPENRDLIFGNRIGLLSNVQFDYRNPNDLTETLTIEVPLCTVDIKTKNKMVKSMPIGASSEIFEYLGAQSMEVTINGILTNAMLPETIAWGSRPATNALTDMCNKVLEFDLNNGYFSNPEKSNIILNNLICESLTLKEPKQFKNIQEFTIIAKQGFLSNSSNLFETLN